jgi:putative RecB family exonuclease
MVEFGYDSLMTFMQCPLKYKFEYIDNINTNKESIKVYFKNTIHQTIKHFFKVLDEEGELLHQKQLNNHWSDLWFERVESEDILRGNKSEKANLTKKGYSFLKKFHRYQIDNPGSPIAVDLDYTINYMDEYKFSGNFELIREIDDKIQIVHFSTSRYVPDEFRQENDVSFTLNSYAFRQMFEKKENETLYYHIRTNKNLPVYRGQGDYNKLLTIMNNIKSCIDQGLFYPRQSYKCKQCPYNRQCTAWEGDNRERL